MSIVYTGGTFDLPHRGHMRLLAHCKKMAGPDGQVVVALNTDEFIQEFKGRLPVMSYDEREAVLENLRFVDRVIPNTNGSDSKPAIMSIRPDFIVIGSDWAQKDYYKQMNFTQEWLDENDITLCYVPYTQGISTTELKKRVTEGKTVPHSRAKK